MVAAGFAYLLLLLLLVTQAQSSIFDVKTYGVKANSMTDDSKAINSAWKDACTAKEASTLVIGKGNYMVGPLKFEGPCAAPVTVQVQGTLKAPADPKQLHDDWVVFRNVERLTVSGGGIFDGQGATAWSVNNCAKTGKCNSLSTNLQFTMLTNSTIEGITSLDSKLFHMSVLNCNNVTFQNIVINAPGNSLNTDGIHIGRSTGVNIIGATIKTGDDCVSLGDGCQQINVEKVTCGPGHGISIGSLGRYHDEEPVNGVAVRNCTLTNTENGVRIKTWPASPSGIASNVKFEDIIMNNVSNPVLIDQQYGPYNNCQAKVPSRVKISNVGFKGIRGTSATQLAVKIVCSRGIPCQNISVEDINLTYNGKEGNSTSLCANVKPQVFGKVFPAACTQSA